MDINSLLLTLTDNFVFHGLIVFIPRAPIVVRSNENTVVLRCSLWFAARPVAVLYVNWITVYTKQQERFQHFQHLNVVILISYSSVNVLNLVYHVVPARRLYSQSGDSGKQAAVLVCGFQYSPDLNNLYCSLETRWQNVVTCKINDQYYISKNVDAPER